MTTARSPTQSLPYRTTGGSVSDDEAVPETDPSDTTSLLLERLRAYKHACGYLEAYITAHEKAEHAHAKEIEKVLKSVSDPLKEGHHFDQKLGGVAGLFENIRSNTQGISNAHLETAKNLKGSVLPILERLHVEIKNKTKELNKGAAKGSKEVDKTRNTTQKHIELLGQHTAAFSSSGGKIEAANDPYILKRGVRHRLHQQVLNENNNRHDLIAVQDSFGAFEAHIIATFQQALNSFLQYAGGDLERQKAMYSDIISTAQRIPPDFEWQGFINRNNNVLIDPSAPPRDISSISFPNQDHQSTQPLIAGTLERKSRVALKGYDTGYYVLSPSKFFHQFASDDDLRKDPTPELSLYLPDCTLGGLNDNKFSVKGKDVSKGKVGSAMSMAHELSFKAHSAADAKKWYSVIEASASGSYTPSSSTLSSPVESRNVSAQQQPPPLKTNQQQTGYQASPITPGAGVQPGSAGPGKLTNLQTSGTTTPGSVPNSGVERAPGQY
ncbi:uncharacterized protein KY384_002662 [Bacidia gigantensis]|uniref:uncharacterized protein n=1 Tax=Bacidia gigantensis TaxID=2732470 RepID=UPI001D05AD4F|nr:uncharacterized protein KY384_002662 [Bacidia gigantensis]KAG8532784.1 hypothetical protein KY384_002662 [Bacidia gigantensis]